MSPGEPSPPTPERETRSRPPLLGWTDGLILTGAALILLVAVYQRNWFFVGIGLAMIGAVGARVAFVRWLAGRNR